MLDYFCKQDRYPEVTVICTKLSELKQRINLGDYATPNKEFDECKHLFDSIKRDAVTAGNETLANAQFVYRAYFQVFCALSAYLGLLEVREYKASWFTLQDCLDCIKLAGKFLDFNARREMPDLYGLLKNYEALYPYNIFGSIGYVIKKSHCSICGKSMQALACPHIRGQLYYGEIAREIIDEAEPLEVSLVFHPDNKRCIIEIGDDSRSEEERFTRLARFLDLDLPRLQRFSVKSIIETHKRQDSVKVERNIVTPLDIIRLI